MRLRPIKSARVTSERVFPGIRWTDFSLRAGRDSTTVATRRPSPPRLGSRLSSAGAARRAEFGPSYWFARDERNAACLEIEKNA